MRRGAALDHMGVRFLVIGFAADDIPKMLLNLALLKGCGIRGLFWSPGRGSIRPRSAPISRSGWRKEKSSSHVDPTVPLAQTADALKVLAGRQAIGKVSCIQKACPHYDGVTTY